MTEPSGGAGGPRDSDDQYRPVSRLSPRNGELTGDEADVVGRLESVGEKLAGESDPSMRAALCSKLEPLLEHISVAEYYRNPRLTNVRNNFALGSYYDAVNIGVGSDEGTKTK